MWDTQSNTPTQVCSLTDPLASWLLPLPSKEYSCRQCGNTLGAHDDMLGLCGNMLGLHGDMLGSIGAKKHQLREEIKILNRKICPDILILLEMMTNEVNTHQIISKLGYDHFDYVLPENHCGGIWILWNNDNISVQVFLKEQRAIHLLVHDKIFNKRKYTIRLDRVISRKDWLDLYPNCLFMDHFLVLIIVIFFLTRTTRSNFIRFRNFGFKTIGLLMMKCTKSSKLIGLKIFRGSRMFRVVCKLKEVKHYLKSWNSKSCGNFFDKAEKNASLLNKVEEKLISDPLNTRLINCHAFLIKPHERLLLFNQKYWRKFHRKEWLTKDDRNSKFFYRCVKTQKQKNSIHRIKDESGVWLDDKSLVEKKNLLLTFLPASNLKKIIYGNL
ncbi:LOW QUALITY PROTEIN: hypothetical protein Cgig2_019186 [Carnegiea gigantea]|uniref:Uncharacterized protein n=1 Tax=Carnegiea gigantea TaxID=171969 RepID=A0A9Q1K3K8_9CARY|nr:LOW QUALITY PROTEIN: hypothetical protein Cgig2_019186 [Carnegiea gigantea]